MNHDADDITFRFKQFAITDRGCGLRLGTDGVLLGAWARLPYPSATSAIDAGTGCGIIALMLAQRFPALTVRAIDIHEGACRDAAVNFARSPWSTRLSVECDSFGAGDSGRYDIIVSNPPFFTSGELSPDTSRATSRHAGSLSPMSLIDAAHDMLNPAGNLSLITPADIEDALICRATFARLYPRRICRVSSVEGRAPVRILWEFSTTDGMIEYTALTIRKTDGSPTDEFRELTRSFYLKF